MESYICFSSQLWTISLFPCILDVTNTSQPAFIDSNYTMECSSRFCQMRDDYYLNLSNGYRRQKDCKGKKNKKSELKPIHKLSFKHYFHLSMIWVWLNLELRHFHLCKLVDRRIQRIFGGSKERFLVGIGFWGSPKVVGGSFNFQCSFPILLKYIYIFFFFYKMQDSYGSIFFTNFQHNLETER
jgi:hypothetical protein